MIVADVIVLSFIALTAYKTRHLRLNAGLSRGPSFISLLFRDGKWCAIMCAMQKADHPLGTVYFMYANHSLTPYLCLIHDSSLLLLNSIANFVFTAANPWLPENNVALTLLLSFYLAFSPV